MGQHRRIAGARAGYSPHRISAMRIIFTEDAKRELEELRRYLEPLSPKGLANVVAALERRIVIASENSAVAGRRRARMFVRLSSRATVSSFRTCSSRMPFTFCGSIDRCVGRSIIPS